MGAAQAHGVELHHDQIANHAFRQIGMLAHLESNVVVDRHVGEQRAELEQHAHAPTQHVKSVAIQLVDQLPANLDRTRSRPELAANQA